MEIETGLQINVQSIVVKQGSVQFNEFNSLKEQAEELAEKIAEVEVNEENVKASKKLLAAVNKKLKELEDKRIEIKKHMLEPYSEFEGQVKEIVGIVKEADGKVREQVKYLEEFERLEKEEAIKAIYEKRVQLYDFKKLFGFNDFLKAKHLNKTTTMKAVEEDMIEWLQKIDDDLKVIGAMPNANEVMSAYVEAKDLSKALAKVNADNERKQQIEASQAMKKVSEQKAVHVLHLFDRKDLKLVEMFMKEANVEYHIVQ